MAAALLASSAVVAKPLIIFCRLTGGGVGGRDAGGVGGLLRLFCWKPKMSVFCIIFYYRGILDKHSLTLSLTNNSSCVQLHCLKQQDFLCSNSMANITSDSKWNQNISKHRGLFLESLIQSAADIYALCSDVSEVGGVPCYNLPCRPTGSSSLRLHPERRCRKSQTGGSLRSAARCRREQSGQSWPRSGAPSRAGGTVAGREEEGDRTGVRAKLLPHVNEG